MSLAEAVPAGDWRTRPAGSSKESAESGAKGEEEAKGKRARANTVGQTVGDSSGSAAGGKAAGKGGEGKKR